jgi:hypothetical protein
LRNVKRSKETRECQNVSSSPVLNSLSSVLSSGDVCGARVFSWTPAGVVTAKRFFCTALPPQSVVFFGTQLEAKRRLMLKAFFRVCVFLIGSNLCRAMIREVALDLVIGGHSLILWRDGHSVADPQRDGYPSIVVNESTTIPGYRF